ncbi:MAG: 50S ribosomal protein L28 [Phycisphaerales bacterium]|nr:50S ribosomal protein L28 [Phycisphaerales bacterium]
MPYECQFTGKKTTFGNRKAYRGQKIKLGGFGLQTSGVTRRTFKPNLQKVNAIITKPNGKTTTKRVYASTRAIKAGMVIKPLKRKYGYTRLQEEAAGE